ncbi:hypothetical protein [Rheinheimera hassiensis]|uniref:hypothetical protein n=1 Tax=Rheinheimera hassiensis TaxID=1193627 RepID=UPI001F0529A4|nr:hypothetical protein [Rheinheimera hassiensis]
MSSKILQGKWVVEWSEIQQQFHVDTLETTLKRNLQAFINDRPSQYVILCIADSQDQAHELCSEIKAVKYGDQSEL